MSLSPNIATNKLSIAQRWQKLYRTIYNAFLKRDFVHIKDFKLFEQQLNTRLATMEANTTAQILATNVNIELRTLAHTHTSTVPGNPTGPGLPAGPLPKVPAPTTPALAIKDGFAQQQDALQQATGPAVAPLGDGMTSEAQLASTTITQDVGAT